MTKSEFDNQKWYKGMKVFIRCDDRSGYVSFIDFEKGNIGISYTDRLYPFEVFKFHEIYINKEVPNE